MVRDQFNSAHRLTTVALLGRPLLFAAQPLSGANRTLSAPDVIVAGGAAPTRALQQATQTIPRASGRDGGSVMTQPPSPLTMLFSRHTKRREFMTLLGGAAVAWPIAARAQQPGERMRRIGILADERWPPIDSLKQGLRNLGYVEGQNLEVVYRFAAGQAERYPGLAAELVALPVELIVALGTPASVAAKRATEAIPIVVQTGDPVAAGLVRNLAHPGGNVTGFSGQAADAEGKRLELLK